MTAAEFSNQVEDGLECDLQGQRGVKFMHIQEQHVTFSYVCMPTSLDAASWQGSCHLLCNGANAIGGKGVFARCKHPHDKLKQAGSDFEIVIKEDAAQEWSEEAVNDGIREAFFLHE